MKIAIVGKGGSGKSSISWLLSEVLLADNKYVLTIDADHNMDMLHIYKQTLDTNYPTLHRLHDQFRFAVNQKEDKRWHEIVLDGRPLPHFTLNPKDDFTDSVTRKIKGRHDLMVVGLGSEDIIFSGRCAHGHSAPLKYYLPLLQTTTQEYVIIDGVAGVDMLNFGLFTGADVLLAVVEPHPNSIRVLREIERLSTETHMPFFIVINKARQNEHYNNITATWQRNIVGEIALEEGLLDYNLATLAPTTYTAARTIIASLHDRISADSGLDRLRSFEAKKQIFQTL